VRDTDPRGAAPVDNDRARRTPDRRTPGSSVSRFCWL